MHVECLTDGVEVEKLLYKKNKQEPNSENCEERYLNGTDAECPRCVIQKIDPLFKVVRSLGYLYTNG